MNENNKDQTAPLKNIKEKEELKLKYVSPVSKEAIISTKPTKTELHRFLIPFPVLDYFFFFHILLDW
jgi:hypothetical protein